MDYELKFMVWPLRLYIANFYIAEPIEVVFTDAEKIFLMGILGESGRKFVNNGVPFSFSKELADKFLEWGYRSARYAGRIISVDKEGNMINKIIASIIASVFFVLGIVCLFEFCYSIIGHAQRDILVWWGMVSFTIFFASLSYLFKPDN